MFVLIRNLLIFQNAHKTTGSFSLYRLRIPLNGLILLLLSFKFLLQIFNRPLGFVKLLFKNLNFLLELSRVLNVIPEDVLENNIDVLVKRLALNRPAKHLLLVVEV